MSIFKKLMFVLMLLSALTVGAIGCGGNGEEQTGGETREYMEDTGEEVGEGVQEGGEEAGEAMEESGEEIGEGAEEMQEGFGGNQ